MKDDYMLRSRWLLILGLLAALAGAFQYIRLGKAQTPPSDWRQKLMSIDGELQTLKSELESYRKEALNVEMHAQPYMRDNWHQFAENIRFNEEDEEKIQAIKERIDTLDKRKQKILKDHPSIH